MAGQHARKAPSAAERWMECPGSIQVAEKLEAMGALTERDEPEYTTEGLAAHEVAAQCLRYLSDGWECVGEKFYGDTICTAEMAENIQMHINLVRSWPGDGELHIEEKVGDGETGGTIDAWKADTTHLRICDLKYGEGIVVEAKENKQQRSYAYELINSWHNRDSIPDDYLIGIYICQPRIYGEKIKKEWISWGQLKEWVQAELLPARARVDIPLAELKPGDHCIFCPAKLGCPAMRRIFDAVAGATSADIKEISDEQFALDCEMIKPARMFLKAMEDERMHRLQHGRKLPGWKMVHGKADRVFKAELEGEKLEDAARTAFGDAAYAPRTLKSPAQIEKTCVGGDQFVMKWAFKPEGSLTVVPDTDKRVSVPSMTERFFDAKTDVDKLAEDI